MMALLTLKNSRKVSSQSDDPDAQNRNIKLTYKLIQTETKDMSEIALKKYNIGMTRGVALVFVVSCMMLLPFLGLTDFNTKGEPREAVVAYTMLSEGNWILPVNNGGEIPYKPPFFHWCVAAASMLTGGVVTEYTSRIPSAMALIAMTCAVFVFYARRRGAYLGLLTAGLLFTAFEIYRAGMNCRVDMMLTALTVGAILSLYKWWETGARRFPWLPILLMSCATLTKGPVGIIIPCLTAGLFMLARGERFWRTFLLMVLWGVLSLILPLCWYYAAYLQGGDEFLRLVMEENFGRMTGTMTYESHVNPWYYNVITLLAGFLPWTLAIVSALFVANYKKARIYCSEFAHQFGCRMRSWRDRLCNEDAVTVLSFVCAIVIFLFYCIPASKRSVYLMPMYPFTAYFIAVLMAWMSRRRPASVRWIGDLLAGVSFVLAILFVIVKCGLIPETIFGHGKHSGENIGMLRSLADRGGFFSWLCVVISVATGVLWYVWHRNDSRLILKEIGVVLGIYVAFSGCYQPGVLQSKSLKPMATELGTRYPELDGNIYEYISIAEEAAGNPVHYFELNFYMGDAVKNFVKERPGSGYLLVGKEDAEERLSAFENQGYRFEEVYAPSATLPRHTPRLYRFEKSPPTP